jgi:hypothetical protein
LRSLAELRFDIFSESFGEMGGAELVLRGSTTEGGTPVWIQIDGDRGHWSIAIRFRGSRPGIPPAIWEAHLDRCAVREPNIAEDARFVEHRLGEAARAVALDPEIEATLLEEGREHMRRRLGLPASDW